MWEVEDRADGRALALKLLGVHAGDAEMQALVREASALSGLEGLGVPRIVGFGRLPGGRPYLVRELVAGASLADRLARGMDSSSALEAVARVADQLTALHRAGLLHGDVKPGNVIVGDDGAATLVDLGLATPLSERGRAAAGLSPATAAPELLRGAPLTVRAEVYSLGKTLEEALTATRPPRRVRSALEAVVARATAARPSDRHPSADELAAELRVAAGISGPQEEQVDAAWPIVGLDAHVHELCDRCRRMPPGASLEIEAPPGAGRTSLLRRLAWSMGVSGARVAWLEGASPRADAAVELELEGTSGEGLILLLDAPERLSARSRELLAAASREGARTVSAGPAPAGAASTWHLPALDGELARELVERAIPSLSGAAAEALIDRSGRRPGALRSLVRRVGRATVVSAEDLVAVLDGVEVADRAPMEALTTLLDEGRLIEARPLVDALLADATLEAAVARARYFIYAGELDRARSTLDAAEALALARPGSRAAREHALYRARALVRRGAYEEAWAASRRALSAAFTTGAGGDELDADACACGGAAQSLLGRHEEARVTLARAVELAERAGSARVAALAYGSLGLAQQRTDQLADARASYTSALDAAERARDAGNVATLRLNLAALASQEGDVAAALGHLEAAVDMGARAGRAATTQQARINLANLDLYLGRLSRAAASIDALASQRGELAPTGAPAAQLLGLQAELAARSGATTRAVELYDRCAAAFDTLSRPADAAEARVEAVLALAREGADPASLARRLAAAQEGLDGALAHRAAISLAEGVVQAARGATARAASALDAALSAAREAGQREWIWRALDARARLAREEGRSQAARRDAGDALAVLEEVASRLPRDLREVYWNDPRRRELRALVEGDSRHTAREDTRPSLPAAHPSGSSTRMLEQDRLARILEINRDLARARELPTVLERVVHHACALVRAERGFVVLLDDAGELVVHATRAGDEAKKEFSRSVAARAIDSGEPIVSLSARDDERMQGFQSVHVLELEAIACVPVRAPDGRAIGALYLEGRGERGSLFEREVATLVAFAEQAAIAIGSLRLLEENSRRASELARANAELEQAKARVDELLEIKQARLDVARKSLKDTRAALYGHFGYRGLVGTSEAMRRVYALIDRVASTDLPVLITGESGTGKEVVARAIHDAGARAKAPFMGINCGAIPANLLETELFGHERGAFTGADRARPGLLRAAGAGTVLLDEIGEMPLAMQPALLRVLEERKLRPIGGSAEEPVEARVLAATHRDLDELVRRGTFREDLVYRLRVVEVRVPPLRDRPEDIPALVDRFLTLFAARHQRPRGGVTREALRKLAGHPWPGNVRQLHHTLLNAWILGDGGEIGAADLELPGQIVEPGAPTVRPRSAGRSRPTANKEDHKAREKARILEALRAAGWNRLKAAERLGIPRRTFYRRLSEYGIQ